MFDYVLVVDDDPVFCEVVRTYLEDQDVKHVLVANLAGDALEILKQKSDQTGFVILDLTMPKFDGIELLKEMKDLFFSGQIAIVSSQTPTVIGMAEELAFEQLAGNGGTVDCYEIAARPRTPGMNALGDQLFSDTGFAEDQDCRVRLRDRVGVFEALK